MDDGELAEALTWLRSPDGDWRSVTGRGVLESAHERLAAIAVRLGFDRSEAVQHAWLFWTELITSAQIAEHRSGLWSYTSASVKNLLLGELAAQDKITSVTHARSGAARATEHVDVLEHDAVYEYAPDEPQDAPASSNASTGLAGSVIGHVFAMAGLTPAEKQSAITAISDRAYESSTLTAAVDALVRERPDALDPEAWRALVVLLLGSAKGAPGLVKLVTDGHPAPLREPHIARLVNVLSGAG